VILVTVGTQLPFDRLIQIVDKIAPELPERIFAQIGKGQYQPANFEWCRTIPPGDFDALIEQATLLVAHAGIGTVLMAQKRRKPLLLFPRRANLREHRNDHQLATVRGLRNRPGIHIAETDDELEAMLREQPIETSFVEPNVEARMRLKLALADYISKEDPAARS
jgi:UDP-N-acetylglucosamine transferase subunit ALG13